MGSRRIRVVGAGLSSSVSTCHGVPQNPVGRGWSWFGLVSGCALQAEPGWVGSVLFGLVGSGGLVVAEGCDVWLSGFERVFCLGTTWVVVWRLVWV